MSIPIHQINDIHALLNDEEGIQQMRKGILDGEVYIVKNVFKKDLIDQFKNYLTGIGRHSFPNYHPIVAGAPNFHRINYWDKRAYVKGCFHQFVFFPWNQDVFNLFERTKSIFQLKNLVSDIPKNQFLGDKVEAGCIARIAFQFYPKGVGGLNMHKDPVAHHQICAPIMILSEKGKGEGKDFEKGGLYVATENGEKIFLDERTDLGDVVFFKAQVAHGVARIDSHLAENWLSFEGRWMLLFATNKIHGTYVVQDSVDLEGSK